MMYRRQGLLLLLRRSLKGNTNVGVAKVGRKEDLGDRSRTNPRVGELIADHFFQFFTDTFGNAFMPMGVHNFRIQYVRENSLVFAAGAGYVAATAPGLFGIREN